MGLFELNKQITLARERGFIFNQINTFKMKSYSNLSNINIHYHIKLGLAPLHRQFFIKSAQNHNYIRTHCIDRRNPFRFACRQWYSYKNPHC